MNNRVSIIIPCYNDFQHLPTALDYANNQTFDEKEIIVIDDGSNAITKKVIQQNISKIDILITQENKGVSAARNNGISKATGRYILTLDSDDYFENGFIPKAIKYFEDNEIIIVSCYAKWFNSQSKNDKIFKPRGGYLKDILFHNVAMGSAMFRKIDWQNVGGYDEKMLLGFEDWEFYIRLLQDGGKAEIIPEVLFNYRNKHGSRNEKANQRKYEILEYIYIKHARLYKQNFSLFVKNSLLAQRRAEEYKKSISKSLEYKIGKYLLKPFRLAGLIKH